MAKIKNAPNTGGLLPQDYTDFNAWIDYWTFKKDGLRNLLRPNKSIYLYRCSKCGHLFAWGDFDGAHVVKVDSQDPKLYIYPLCKECNRGREQTPFGGLDVLLLEMPPKKS